MPRQIRRALAALAVVATFSAASPAVVIDAGDGTANASAPPDDFGFDHLGVAANKLSVVYLGRGWVLTANHVGEQEVTLKGNLYSPVAGSSIQLSGPDPKLRPDLRLYRLKQGPALPALVLSSTPAAIGEAMHCVGHGWNRQADLSYWGPLWQETPLLPGSYRGYKRGEGREVRWGRNAVSDVGFDEELVNSQGDVVSSTRAFATTFDEIGGFPDEFQSVSGDSGGGCFAKRGGSWELTGLMFARSVEPGQADPNTAVFGNQSLQADLEFYASQIRTIIEPADPERR